MEKNRKEVIAKLQELSKGKKSQWVEDAQFRVDNQEWLKKSQAIALIILRKLRANKLTETVPNTQVQLAELLGVQPQQVNKWVKGNENFTIETISKLEKALSIRLLGSLKHQPEIFAHKTLIARLNYLRSIKSDIKKSKDIKETKIIWLYEKSSTTINSNTKKLVLQS